MDRDDDDGPFLFFENKGAASFSKYNHAIDATQSHIFIHAVGRRQFCPTNNPSFQVQGGK